MYSTQVGPVVYNPATRAFEALVTLNEGLDGIRIPCSLRFPIDAPASVVVPALIRQAKEKRQSNRAPLVSRLSRLAEGSIAA
ncbi:hypothetical protein EF888_20645 [Silicimonas algicola]|uniref:Uncharacterized protein n=1 Tax=Silicimonas algicola TaxID=1826607 RepID=A0A316G9J3_9RHOB|nr:hypothetical protein [Silicimonas algicola]AZQ69337.1 hypothetical protein EF888_20645 [Silicimonas algicola]PWK56400.1 hypothetical protein C8D95_10471 [Silicimonas algicola]